MAKSWVSFLCAISVILLAGCNRGEGIFPPVKGGKGKIEVQVRQTFPDCDVDNEWANVRTATTTPDNIRWCLEDNSNTTKYYIHFEANHYNNVDQNSPVGTDATTETNDFEVKKNQCSHWLVPVTGKQIIPGGYVYKIYYNSPYPTGQVCHDPKVILK